MGSMWGAFLCWVAFYSLGKISKYQSTEIEMQQYRKTLIPENAYEVLNWENP